MSQAGRSNRREKRFRKQIVTQPDLSLPTAPASTSSNTFARSSNSIRGGSNAKQKCILFPVPASRAGLWQHETAHPQSPELPCERRGHARLPAAPAGHRGPHQSRGVQPRVRGADDSQSGVGGACGGGGLLKPGRDPQTAG